MEQDADEAGEKGKEVYTSCGREIDRAATAGGGRSVERPIGRSKWVRRSRRQEGGKQSGERVETEGGRSGRLCSDGKPAGRPKSEVSKKVENRRFTDQEKNRGVHGDVTEIFLMLCARWTHVG